MIPAGYQSGLITILILGALVTGCADEQDITTVAPDAALEEEASSVTDKDPAGTATSDTTYNSQSGTGQQPPLVLDMTLPDTSAAEMEEAARSADFEAANRKPDFFAAKESESKDKKTSVKVVPSLRPGAEEGDLPDLDGGSVEFKYNTN